MIIREERALRHLRTRLERHPLLRGVTAMASGTLISQALSVAALPIISRLYSPWDLGTYATYTSLIMILLVAVSLRYELAIPIPSSDAAAYQLLILAMVLTLGMSTICGLSVLLLVPLLRELMHTSFTIPFLWAVPFTLLGAGIYQALSYWVTRVQQFSTITRTRIVQSVAQLSAQIAGGCLGFGTVALVLGDMVARWLGLAQMARSVPRWTRVGWQDMARRAREYAEFPKYTLWTGIINTVGLQLPAPVLNWFFSPAVVGQFSLAMRVLGVPGSLIGQAVAQALYPVALRRKEDGALPYLLENVVTRLCYGSMFVFGLIILAGPTVFSAIFGPKWDIAGEYARFLCPWFMFSFVSSPISTIVLVLNRQRQAMYVTFYETLLRIAGIAAGGLLASAAISVVAYSVAGATISAIYIAWVMRLAGVRASSLWRRIRRSVLCMGLALPILFACTQVIRSEISIILAVTTYCAAALWSALAGFRGSRDSVSRRVSE